MKLEDYFLSVFIKNKSLSEKKWVHFVLWPKQNKRLLIWRRFSKFKEKIVSTLKILLVYQSHIQIRLLIL